MYINVSHVNLSWVVLLLQTAVKCHVDINSKQLIFRPFDVLVLNWTISKDEIYYHTLFSFYDCNCNIIFLFSMYVFVTKSQFYSLSFFSPWNHLIFIKPQSVNSLQVKTMDDDYSSISVGLTLLHFHLWIKAVSVEPQ